MANFLFLFALLASGRPRNLSSQQLKAIKLKATNSGYTDQYFVQPVDHINNEPGTFVVKALIRQGSLSAPIFVYTGNEGAIQEFFDITGWLVDVLGPAYNATVAFIEHRYYGESLIPNSNYKYLSSTQALWDYADIIEQISKANTTRPVIAFGGSYGGMLSAMFRIKYPHLVDGAIASSAPLLMGDLSGSEFMKKVTQDYEAVSTNCSDYIWKAFEILTNIQNRELYFPTLEKIFKPCSSISNTQHVIDLQSWLSDAIVTMAQFNYPYPANVAGPLPANPVISACSLVQRHFEAQEIWDVMTAMQEIANLYFNGTETLTCFDIYGAQSSDDLAWEYQTCTEFNIPIGQYGWPSDMFPKAPWDPTTFKKNCIEQYGVGPRLKWEGVNYGMQPNYKETLQYMNNIVLSYGTIDPWGVGCFQEDFDEEQNLVIGITGGAHHIDLRAPHPHDPPAVILAREKEKNLIDKWITQKYYK